MYFAAGKLLAFQGHGEGLSGGVWERCHRDVSWITCSYLFEDLKITLMPKIRDTFLLNRPFLQG